LEAEFPHFPAGSDVSKHDTHFFNVFSVVLGLLVAFAIMMFALARYVGKHTQTVQMQNDPMMQSSVAERVGMPARVAVAGQDNTAMAIAPVTSAPTTIVAVVYKSGADVYEGTCKVCHGVGLAGAPKTGDAAARGRPRAPPRCTNTPSRGLPAPPGPCQPRVVVSI
jgi:cytochrome c5